MSIAVDESYCVRCNRNKVVYRCEGCSQAFCFEHLEDHRQEFNSQLNAFKRDHDHLQQKFAQQRKNPPKHVLIQEINQWERNSIDLIQETAEEARQSLRNCIADNKEWIADKFTEFSDELKTTQKENNFNEIHVNRLRRKLKLLEEQLNMPLNISVRYDFSSFIKRICVVQNSRKYSIRF